MYALIAPTTIPIVTPIPMSRAICDVFEVISVGTMPARIPTDTPPMRPALSAVQKAPGPSLTTKIKSADAGKTRGPTNEPKTKPPKPPKKIAATFQIARCLRIQRETTQAIAPASTAEERRRPARSTTRSREPRLESGKRWPV